MIDRPAERSIFIQALDLAAPGEREAFLQKACAGEPRLLERVVHLLDQHERRQGPLDAPAPHIVPTGLMPELNERPGTRIGPYKIREQIGEGGFGIVYVAEQEKPVARKVALKIIKPGMDSRDVIARFEAERQALALMDHPNVARVLDAGATDSGRPYFVMELVKGLPITEFCDRQKLSNRERLELFVDVCRAIQHAHQKGIIHRDLKPSNVMVTMHDDKPVPKVIDFGVAKALSSKLTEKTVYTAYGQMVGTPLYMSPEQAQLSGLDVDTRSDVYSLGVLLYELLTGTTPFNRETLKQAGFDELRRIICEVEPPRPSTKFSTLDAHALSTIADRRRIDPRKLRQCVQGELDWIVMKTLEKDRNRRYESASALAADVRRLLNDEPVHACPPSAAYRLRKLAARHKAGLVTVTLIAATLLIATGVSTTYAIRADQARDDADQERANAVAAQQQSDENFSAALDAIDKLLAHASSRELAEISQAQPVRRRILEDVLAFQRQFRLTTGDSQQVRFRAAETWAALGQLSDDLGDIDQACRAYENALDLLNDLVSQFPNNWTYQVRLLRTTQRYGYVHYHGTNNFDRAKTHHLRAEEIATALLRGQGDAEPALIQENLADVVLFSRIAVANVSRSKGDDETHRKLIDEAYRQRNSSPRDHLEHVDAVLERQMARIHDEHDPELAAQHFLRAVEIHRQILKEYFHRSTREWHGSLAHEASLFFRQRDPALAMEFALEAVEIQRGLATEFPSFPDEMERLARYLTLYVELTLANGAEDDAESILNDLRGTVSDQQWDELVTTLLLARVLKHQQLGHYERALEDYQELIRLRPQERKYHQQLAKFLYDNRSKLAAVDALTNAIQEYPTISAYWRYRGVIYRDSQRYEQALEDLNKAVELLTEDGDSNTHLSRGMLYVRMQKLDEASRDFARFVERDPDDALVYRALGETLEGEGLFDEAVAAYTEYLNREHSRELSYAFKRRARCYFYLKQYDRTLADIASAVERNAGDLSNLTWVGTIDIARCPDQSLRDGLIELADRTLDLTDDAPMAYVTRGYLKALWGDMDEAVSDYERGTTATEDPGLRARHYFNAAWYVATSSRSTPQHIEKAEEWVSRAAQLEGASDAPASLYQPSQPEHLMRFLPTVDPYVARGSLFAVLNMPLRATADFEQFLSSDSTSHYSHYYHALACLRMNDVDAYRNACSSMLARFADSDDPLELRITAWTCLLGPSALEDYEPAIEVARAALALEPEAIEHQQTLGAILYRAGRYKEAAESLQAAAAANVNDNTSTAYGDYFLAMTHDRMGNADEARQFLERANAQADRETADPTFWNRRFTLQLFRNEAEGSGRLSSLPRQDE